VLFGVAAQQRAMSNVKLNFQRRTIAAQYRELSRVARTCGGIKENQEGQAPDQTPMPTLLTPSAHHCFRLAPKMEALLSSELL
jgi:hypothetical protein